ncbi:hypothetical protein FB561_0021 [Kribbella amoyensis]|uniref:Uncharacterized protein n=1 Tax=Kribbella amoyensis TaxID=996641 RepID=A0A561BJE1_9ACTN|nr:hypothetical protein [Kribbella amoyensis]TWD78973.1 hypothetical protein FB561_0021 [Kribbella amoyensis]
MDRLGIDIGRVIIDGSAGPGDTSFFQGDRAAMLRTPAVAEAFATIARLVQLFDGQAWLVSKCGPRIQQRSLDWLLHHRFFERTGIPADHVRFCLRRPDKAIHCRELGITHFVDDKPDVHEALAGLVPYRYLFGPQRSRHVPAGVTATRTWSEVETAIAGEPVPRSPRPVFPGP